MKLPFSLVLSLALLPSQVSCATVQDDWSAPANPEGATTLKSGARFTITWKSKLKDWFPQYCGSCNTTNLDLWISNRKTPAYADKIGSGIDVTKTTSYEWNVNIASNVYTDQEWWQFQFRRVGATYLDPDQISSPGFHINGLSIASASVSTQSNSATSAASSTSSTTTPSTSAAPAATTQTPRSSKSKAWIAGAVIGPVIGIALVLALVWFCLRRRKNQKEQQPQGDTNYYQGNMYQPAPTDEAPKEVYAQRATPWLHEADGQQHQFIAEAPGDTHLSQPSQRPIV